MQGNFKLSETPPSQLELARIAGVFPVTVRRNITLLLKMALDLGYEIVEPIPLGLFNQVTRNGKKSIR